MHDTLEHLIPIVVPITATDRSQAEAFAQAHLHPEKADHVFRNTLAIMATHRYLQMLAIASDPKASWSWHRAGQLLDEADLYVPEKQGYLECRPIRQGDTHCWIPETVQSERIGYVIVQLDEPYREGSLLGFVPHVSVSKLPLSDLQPLDYLIDCLTETGSIALSTPIATLSHWLNRIFEIDWQPHQALLNPMKLPMVTFCNSQKECTEELVEQVAQLYRKQENQPGALTVHETVADPKQAIVYLIQMTQDDEIRWQAAELLWEIDPNHSAGAVRSAKDLGLYLAGHQVALMVGILSKPDGRMLILTRVYPIEQEPHLPPGLQLVGFDEEGNSFFNIKARHQDDYIQFKFTADLGDRFTLQVSFNDASVTESFIV
ncbi:MAG: DUF1822 family protein [Cyanobacteria bacterium CRU_2_1]|nr:DUF1822 family protein [Cyanobacteria bacterium RU_5_0]NJR58185.1 DUF1822 family protein [Cyanobacteria bacterium CRU_2_1]